MRRLRLEWSERDAVTGPDGTQYSVHSEHVRGESRYWVPGAVRPGEEAPYETRRLAYRPPDFPDEADAFPRGYSGSRAAARAWCEMDAAARMEEAHQIQFRQYPRGHAPIRGWGGTYVGYRLICSCGNFTQRINGPKPEARAAAKRHVPFFREV